MTTRTPTRLALAVAAVFAVATLSGGCGADEPTPKDAESTPSSAVENGTEPASGGQSDVQPGSPTGADPAGGSGDDSDVTTDGDSDAAVGGGSASESGGAAGGVTGEGVPPVPPPPGTSPGATPGTPTAPAGAATGAPADIAPGGPGAGTDVPRQLDPRDAELAAVADGPCRYDANRDLVVQKVTVSGTVKRPVLVGVLLALTADGKSTAGGNDSIRLEQAGPVSRHVELTAKPWAGWAKAPGECVLQISWAPIPD